jgi:hypothetical protein
MTQLSTWDSNAKIVQNRIKWRSPAVAGTSRRVKVAAKRKKFVYDRAVRFSRAFAGASRA